MAYAEYEDTLEAFLASLSTESPDDFTQSDREKIKWYIKSDGCTDVPDFYVSACEEHDFYFRTRHDFSGKIISFKEANRRFRLRIQKQSKFGVWSPLSWIRWAGVSLFGRNAWKRNQCYRGALG